MSPVSPSVSATQPALKTAYFTSRTNMEKNSIYGDIDAPELDPAALKKDLSVQTRIFWDNSVAGSRARVVSFKTGADGKVRVRCNYGQNQSGKSLLKWMPCFALALA